ncbi:hypothetical protein BWI97_08740 [Siphonobacter sp. BAB-5405]|uniref:hypothetical protein n=1 Tax=Siphonobacter sp. BAB-5405 TaxID=1864825 RepID=UPI000C7F94D5|nr:hypothetical protein [Siphonobacter sp. BAB-5405]PMD97686.1 hypothetical protein BWI97_08740 [Siphonobacter sp. BAB-5405]
MLIKYKLIHVPEGGVDHLINGQRVTLSNKMTDEQAEILIAAGPGKKYFKKVRATPVNQSNGQKESKSGTKSGSNRKPSGNAASNS